MVIKKENGALKIKDEDLRIFYLCVHKKLCQRTEQYQEKIMDRKDFYDILGRLYHLPKKLWPCVIKEMIEMKMIEDLGNRKNNNILILPMIKDPEESANEFYQKLGIF